MRRAVLCGICVLIIIVGCAQFETKPSFGLETLARADSGPASTTRLAQNEAKSSPTNLQSEAPEFSLRTEPAAFVSLSPARLLDTRRGVGAPVGPVKDGQVVVLTVAGVGGVPVTNAAAVSLNLTATAPTGAGYVTVWADGTAKPTASNLNFGPGQTVANLVTAPVGADGRVDLVFSGTGNVQLIADVSGYFLAGASAGAGGFVSLSPARLLDTRRGVGAPVGPVKDGQVVVLTVAGVGGVPVTNAAAVSLNLTATAPTGAGYVTVWADGTAKPTASNLNFGPGQTVANLVTAPVGADGRVDLVFSGTGNVQLIADVSGYFLAPLIVYAPDSTFNASVTVSGLAFPASTISIVGAARPTQTITNATGEFSVEASLAPDASTMMAIHADKDAWTETVTTLVRQSTAGAHGTISGVVVDVGSGQPVANANVRFGQLMITTGLDGTYVLSGVPDGIVALSISSPGHMPNLSTVKVAGGKPGNSDDATLLLQGNAASVTLTPTGGTLSGPTWQLKIPAGTVDQSTTVAATTMDFTDLHDPYGIGIVNISTSQGALVKPATLTIDPSVIGVPLNDIQVQTRDTTTGAVQDMHTSSIGGKILLELDSLSTQLWVKLTPTIGTAVPDVSCTPMPTQEIATKARQFLQVTLLPFLALRIGFESKRLWTEFLAGGIPTPVADGRTEISAQGARSFAQAPETQAAYQDLLGTLTTSLKTAAAPDLTAATTTLPLASIAGLGEDPDPRKPPIDYNHPFTLQGNIAGGISPESPALGSDLKDSRYFDGSVNLVTNVTDKGVRTKVSAASDLDFHVEDSLDFCPRGTGDISYFPETLATIPLSRLEVTPQAQGGTFGKPIGYQVDYWMNQAGPTALADLTTRYDSNDPDHDGWPDTEPWSGATFSLDNCPGVANPDQVDSDNDGDGDACSCPLVGLHEGLQSKPFTATTATCSVSNSGAYSYVFEPTPITVYPRISLDAAGATYFAGTSAADGHDHLMQIAGGVIKHVKDFENDDVQPGVTDSSNGLQLTVAQSRTNFITTSHLDSITADGTTIHEIARGICDTQDNFGVCKYVPNPQTFFTTIFNDASINNAGVVAFIATPAATSPTASQPLAGLYVAKNATVLGTSADSFYSATGITLGDPRTTFPAVDSSGDVLLKATRGGASSLLVFPKTLGSNPAVLAATSQGGGANAPPCGSTWTTLGNRPSISLDGAVVAFAGDRGHGLGVFACIKSGATWRLVVITGDGASRFGDLGLPLTSTAGGSKAPYATGPMTLTITAETKNAQGVGFDSGDIDSSVLVLRRPSADTTGGITTDVFFTASPRCGDDPANLQECAVGEKSDAGFVAHKAPVDRGVFKISLLSTDLGRRPALPDEDMAASPRVVLQVGQTVAQGSVTSLTTTTQPSYPVSIAVSDARTLQLGVAVSVGGSGGTTSSGVMVVNQNCDQSGVAHRQLPCGETVSASLHRVTESFETYCQFIYNDGLGCRLADPAHPTVKNGVVVDGNCTVGIGHLVHLGPCIAADVANWGGGLTLVRAQALERSDIRDKIVAMSATGLGNVPLMQQEYDSLIDFWFNTKSPTSSDLYKTLISAGHPYYAEAARNFLTYGISTQHGGRVIYVCGLVKRRVSDNYIYRTGEYLTNIDPATGSQSITCEQISSLTPSAGDPFTGVPAVVAAGAFAADTTMWVDGSDSAASVNGAGTSLTFDVPQHAHVLPNQSVNGKVVVLATSRTQSANADLSHPECHWFLVYHADPNLTCVSLNHGPAAGGNVVTLTGTGLAHATSADFDGRPATGLVHVSATQIRVTAPAGTGGVQIVAHTPAGDTPTDLGLSDYTYAPVVTGLSESSGLPGDTVEISGSSFTGATAVSFGDAEVAPSDVAVQNDSLIRVVVPPHAGGAVSVAVTTMAGTSPVGAAARFLYLTAAAQAPAAPTLTATSAVDSVALAWNRPSDGGAPILGYTLTRTNQSTGEVVVLSAPASATSLSDTAVLEGILYSYRIAASNSVGLGQQSLTATATPIAASVPSTPTLALAAAPGSMKLSWDVQSNGGADILGFRILRSTSSGSETVLTEVDTSATAFTDSAVDSGTTYFYQVSVFNRSGASGSSSEVSGRPLQAVPDGPILQATPTAGQVALTWTAPSNRTGAISRYSIYRGDGPGQEHLIKTIPAPTTSFLDTILTPGSNYWYQVSATNAAGEGARSNELRVQVPGAGARGACVAGASPVVRWSGGAGDGVWSAAGNWVGGKVPTAADGVCLPAGSQVTVSVAAAAGSVESLGSLTVAAGLTLSGSVASFLSGATSVTGAGQLHVAGPLHVSGNVVWGEMSAPSAGDFWSSSIDGVGSLVVDAGGSVTVHAGLCTSRVAPAASTFSGGCASLSVPVVNDGTITVSSGTLFRDSDTAGWSNSGTLDLADHNGYGSTVGGDCPQSDVQGDVSSTCGAFPLVNTGTIARSGGTLASTLAGVLLTSTGTLSAATGTLQLRTQGSHDIAGKVSAAAGATVAFTGSDSLLLEAGDTISGAGTLSALSSNVEVAGPSTIAGLAVVDGQLTLDRAATVSALLVTGGILNGPGAVTVTDSMQLAGGTVASAGTVTVGSKATLAWTGGGFAGSGGTVLSAGSVTAISGSLTDHTINNRGFTTAGTVDFQAGFLSTSQGSVHNTGSWTLEQPAATSPTQLNDTGGFRFVNDGHVTVTGGTPDNPIRLSGYAGGTGTLTMTGALQLAPAAGVAAPLTTGLAVPTGSSVDLSFRGGQAPAGSFLLPAGASLGGGGAVTVPGQMTVNGVLTARSVAVTSGGQLSGTGSVTVTGGTFTLTGTLTGALTTTLQAGTTGAWDGGGLTSTGTTTVAAGATLTATQYAGKAFSSGTLVNNGTAQFLSGDVNATSGTIRNNGTWTLNWNGQGGQQGSHIFDAGPGTFRFLNAGTFTSTAGAGQYATALDGYAGGPGTIHVTAGQLRLQNPPAVTVPFDSDVAIPTGATLELFTNGNLPAAARGTFTVPAGHSITGAGTLQIDNAATLTSTGNITPATVQNAGQLTVNGVLTARSVAVTSGGQLSGTGSVTVTGGTFTLTGTLTGALTTTLQAGTTGAWDGGGLTSTGTTTVAAGATLTATQYAGKAFSSGTLVNNGTAQFLSGDVNATSGTIRNNGTWTLNWNGQGGQQGSHIFDAGPGTFRFLNAGTFTSTAGAGQYATALDGYAGGPGTIHVTAGQLRLQNPPAVTVPFDSDVAIPTGATLELFTNGNLPAAARGTFTVPAGHSITGAGTLQIDNAATLTSTGGTLSGIGLVNAGYLTLPVGTSILASFVQQPGASLTVPVTAAGAASITAPTATVADTLVLAPVNGFRPAVGTRYTLFTDAGGLTGTFTTLTNPAGQTYTPTYTATGLSVTMNTSARRDARRSPSCSPAPSAAC